MERRDGSRLGGRRAARGRAARGRAVGRRAARGRAVGRRAAVALVSALFALASLGCSESAAPTDGGRDAGLDAAPDADPDPADGAADALPACVPGEGACDGLVHYRCGADGRARLDVMTCEHACDPRLGCVRCEPGARRCRSEVSERCAPDGDRWVHGRSCSEWGSSCDEESGLCDDPCAEAEEVASNVGCEFWAVPLPNWDELNPFLFDFRLVVSNPNDLDAVVTVYRAEELVVQERVAPGELQELTLPWLGDAGGGFSASEWKSFLRETSSYRVESDRPIIVGQLNPYDFASNDPDFPMASYSNDASLLLPTHALVGDYVGVSYPTLSITEGEDSTKRPGYLAVVATAPGTTEVHVTAAGRLAAAERGLFDAQGPGDTVRVTLERGDYLLLAAAEPPACEEGRPGYRRCASGDPLCSPGTDQFCREVDFDLTGSRLEADQPIAVFGGHVCAFVPYDRWACDHLETQLPPAATWGRRFSGAPLSRPTRRDPNLLRVVARDDGTTVQLRQREGTEAFDLDAGEWDERMVTGPFSLEADGPILATQLMVGQDFRAPSASVGDPSLTTLVPEGQHRSDYVFSAPSSYPFHFAMISRLPERELRLDDEPVDESAFERIGEREVAIIPIPSGTHRLEGDGPFGFILFGLAPYTSYAIPGGTDLRPGLF